MRGAYYNECDRYKAAWLRELIKRDVIAPGDVDERSIEHVRSDDVRGYAQCHWFAGIGVWSWALRLAGWPDERPVWTGSCPCPSFSAAGKGEGFDDARHLWPVWFAIIRESRPPIIFGEQSDAAIGHGWLDLVSTDLEASSYAFGAAVLGACSIGAPHRRQRLYFVADASGAELETRIGRMGVQRGTNGAARAAVESHGADGILADSASGRRGKLGNASFAGSGGHDDGGSITGDLADSDGGGCFIGGEAYDDNGCNASGHELDRRDQAGGMADSNGGGHLGAHDAGISGSRVRQEESARNSDAGGESGGTGPLNGFWRDADWIYCRDHKWRPVESGSFPLAHGTSVRVLRLRGYGDAICAELAAEFIRAAAEVIAEK